MGLSDYGQWVMKPALRGSQLPPKYMLCSVAVQDPQEVTVLEGRGWAHGEMGSMRPGAILAGAMGMGAKRSPFHM